MVTSLGKSIPLSTKALFGRQSTMIDRTYKSQTPTAEPIFVAGLLRLQVMSPKGNSCGTISSQ